MQPAIATAPLSGGTATGQCASTSPVGKNDGFRLALQTVQATTEQSSAAPSGIIAGSTSAMPPTPLTTPSQQMGRGPVPAVVPTGMVSRMRMNLKAGAAGELAKNAGGVVTPGNDATPATVPRDATSEVLNSPSASIQVVPESSLGPFTQGGSIGIPQSGPETAMPSVATNVKPSLPAVASAKSSILPRTDSTFDAMPNAATVALPAVSSPLLTGSAFPGVPASSDSAITPFYRLRQSAPRLVSVVRRSR